MDAATKQEILDAMDRHADETKCLVDRIVATQLEQSAEIVGLKERLAALEARGGAWDTRLAQQEKTASDDRQALTSAIRGLNETCVEILSILKPAAKPPVTPPMKDK